MERGGGGDREPFSRGWEFSGHPLATTLFPCKKIRQGEGTRHSLCKRRGLGVRVRYRGTHPHPPFPRGVGSTDLNKKPDPPVSGRVWALSHPSLVGGSGAMTTWGVARLRCPDLTPTRGVVELLWPRGMTVIHWALVSRSKGLPAGKRLAILPQFDHW